MPHPLCFIAPPSRPLSHQRFSHLKGSRRKSQIALCCIVSQHFSSLLSLHYASAISLRPLIMSCVYAGCLVAGVSTACWRCFGSQPTICILFTSWIRLQHLNETSSSREIEPGRGTCNDHRQKQMTNQTHHYLHQLDKAHANYFPRPLFVFHLNFQLFLSPRALHRLEGFGDNRPWRQAQHPT